MKRYIKTASSKIPRNQYLREFLSSVGLTYVYGYRIVQDTEEFGKLIYWVRSNHGYTVYVRSIKEDLGWNSTLSDNCKEVVKNLYQRFKAKAIELGLEDRVGIYLHSYEVELRIPQYVES